MPSALSGIACRSRCNFTSDTCDNSYTAPLAMQRPSRRRVAADIGVLAISLAVLAAGAVTASRLTSAFIVQLIFTSSPLITAVISSLTTRELWPPKLWETLGLTLLGSGGCFMHSPICNVLPLCIVTAKANGVFLQLQPWSSPAACNQVTTLSHGEILWALW